MKAAHPPLWKRLVQAFSQSSYSFPVGSQNQDGFERNLDTRMFGNRNRDLTHSAAMSCVKLISNTSSTLPLFTYLRMARGRQLAVDEDLYTLLHDSPNADMTAQTFVQVLVASILRNGIAYGEKRVGTGGRLVAIDYLDYDRLQWRVEQGVRVYRYTDLDGSSREIPRNRLWRTLGFSLDGMNEISAIQYGARIFNSAQLADIAANRTFVNGLMPTVAFSIDKILTPKQRTEFRTEFKKEIAGARNAGESPLLEGGMTASPIGINPQDAQLLESRAWSVEEICRWYGVPPFMVGHSEKSTSWGTGLEQQNLGFLTYCLRPILKAIEQSVAKDLMTVEQRQKFYVEFAIDALLRSDSAGRAALYASAAQNGWMTREEIRQLENLPFIEGADTLTAQSNLLPLDKLGEEKAMPAPVDDAIKQMILAIGSNSKSLDEGRLRALETRAPQAPSINVSIPPPQVKIEKLDVTVQPQPVNVEVHPPQVRVQVEAPQVKVDAPNVTIDTAAIAAAVRESGDKQVEATDRVAKEIAKPSKAVFDGKGEPIGVRKVDSL